MPCVVNSYKNNYCKIIWNRPTWDLTSPTVIYRSVSKSNSTCICSICLIFTDHKPLQPKYHSFLNIIFVKSVDTSFEILSRKTLMRNLLQIYTNTCNNGCFFITHSFKYIFPSYYTSDGTNCPYFFEILVYEIDYWMPEINNVLYIVFRK